MRCPMCPCHVCAYSAAGEAAEVFGGQHCGGHLVQPDRRADHPQLPGGDQQPDRQQQHLQAQHHPGVHTSETAATAAVGAALFCCACHQHVPPAAATNSQLLSWVVCTQIHDCNTINNGSIVLSALLLDLVFCLFLAALLLQIKAWCYYESRLLGAHHGLISTYALETLVLYVFNKYHSSSMDSPLAVSTAWQQQQQQEHVLAAVADVQLAGLLSVHHCAAAGVIEAARQSVLACMIVLLLIALSLHCGLSRGCAAARCSVAACLTLCAFAWCRVVACRFCTTFWLSSATLTGTTTASACWGLCRSRTCPVAASQVCSSVHMHHHQQQQQQQQPVQRAVDSLTCRIWQHQGVSAAFNTDMQHLLACWTHVMHAEHALLAGEATPAEQAAMAACAPTCSLCSWHMRMQRPFTSANTCWSFIHHVPLAVLLCCCS